MNCLCSKFQSRKHGTVEKIFTNTFFRSNFFYNSVNIMEEVQANFKSGKFDNECL